MFASRDPQTCVRIFACMFTGYPAQILLFIRLLCHSWAWKHRHALPNMLAFYFSTQSDTQAVPAFDCLPTSRGFLLTSACLKCLEALSTFAFNEPKQFRHASDFNHPGPISTPTRVSSFDTHVFAHLRLLSSWWCRLTRHHYENASSEFIIPIFDGFCTLEISRREVFQGIARGIRDFWRSIISEWRFVGSNNIVSDGMVDVCDETCWHTLACPSPHLCRRRWVLYLTAVQSLFIWNFMVHIFFPRPDCTTDLCKQDSKELLLDPLATGGRVLCNGEVAHGTCTCPC